MPHHTLINQCHNTKIYYYNSRSGHHKDQKVAQILQPNWTAYISIPSLCTILYKYYTFKYSTKIEKKKD